MGTREPAPVVHAPGRGVHRGGEAARIREVSGEQITAFFHRYAREQGLSAWQFRQMVDAVQLLVVDLADGAAAGEVDGDYWKAAGEDLPADHPTRARQQTPEEAVAASPRYARARRRITRC